MFSARTIFEEIFDNDEAFQLFCSIAASGEGQGGGKRPYRRLLARVGSSWQWPPGTAPARSGPQIPRTRPR